MSQRPVTCFCRLLQQENKWILKETRHLSIQSENE